MELVKCFIPYCEEPVVRKGVSHWMEDSPVFVRAFYCDVHKYGGGMGVGTPVRTRPASFKKTTEGDN